jgi:RimJ/RimL family protein N-acetyltransferase
MITLQESTNYDLLTKIITEPKLFKVTYGQDKNPNWEIDKTFRYFVINQEDEILGCFQIKEMTKFVLEVHIFLLSRYWGTAISLEAAKIGNDWIREQRYTKAFTRVPANAIHVIKFVSALGYKACGMLDKAIIYNNVLVSIFFFELEV